MEGQETNITRPKEEGNAILNSLSFSPPLSLSWENHLTIPFHRDGALQNLKAIFFYI